MLEILVGFLFFLLTGTYVCVIYTIFRKNKNEPKIGGVLIITTMDDKYEFKVSIDDPYRLLTSIEDDYVTLRVERMQLTDRKTPINLKVD